jgi:hypothetical protein
MDPYKGPIEVNDTAKLQRYKDEICQLAMDLYNDGANGISTFNWYFHLHLAEVPIQWQTHYGYGLGGALLQSYFLSILGDADAINRYQEESWVLPAKQ